MKKVKRLFADFKPEHYELLLEPDRDKSVFSGKVVIDGYKAGRPSQRITLHSKGLKIKSAKITKLDKTGEAVISIDRMNIQKSYDELRLHTKQLLHAGKYKIELEFSGKITEPMHGIYPCNFELNGQKKQLVATQFESHHAREAFPCIDEPEAKATFGLTLSTSAGKTVIANTPVKKQKTVKGRLVTEFDKTPKMSTYLLAFAFGDLKHKQAKTSGGVDIRVFATPDKLELTDFALDVATRCLEFFEDYYGVAYPLPKLDLLGLPDFSAGAMENWGLITFREQVYYVDPQHSSIETKQVVAMVICHEISHQWFGNLVTMKWWNDLWLNESFANMMEYQAVDALFPEWNIWKDFVQRELSMALSRDALPNVQAVKTEVNHPDELGALFDPAIVYAKGGCLLNMVRWLVGEDSFRKGLNSYFKEFQYQNTTAANLWRHLKQASGTDIEAVMKNWLEKPGFPVIEVEHEPQKNTFSARQQRLVVGKSQDETIWQVPLAASQPTDKKLLGSESASFKLAKQTGHPLTLNHDGRSYLVVRYNKGHMDSLLVAVKKDVLSPTDRLLLVQNSLLLERAGRVSTLENLQLLDAYANERDEAVWGMLSGTIGSVRALIDKDAGLEERLNSYVRPIAAPLVNSVGWSSGEKDTSQTLKLRAVALSMAAAAEDKDVIAEGLKLFKGFSRPADLAPDIRAVIYYIAVRYGNDDDYNKLLKLYCSLTNADEKEEVSAELTNTRDPKKIQHLLAMMTDEVRLQDVPTWFAWLMRNRYSRDLAWSWLQANWKWVEEKFGDDKSYDRFARYAAAAFSYQSQLKEYKAFFVPKSNIALERPIKLGIEEIESRVEWRKRNEASVKKWLGRL